MRPPLSRYIALAQRRTAYVASRAIIEKSMPVDQNNLIWIDMEMTGLQPDSDRIIEIALLVNG